MQQKGKAETNKARPQTVDETEVLLPDRAVPLRNGETVTVQELKFLQTLRLSGVARPLIEDMVPVMQQGQKMKLMDLEALFAKHEQATLQLISASIGKPVEWIADLPDEDGRSLLFTFWSVNHDFFTGRMMTLVINRAASTLASDLSLPH